LTGWEALFLVAAVAIAITTWSLGPAACGENQPGCGATSRPVLAIIFAWVGAAGVAIAMRVKRRSWRRATTIVILLTAAIYLAWLITFVVTYVPDERDYRNRQASLQVAYSSSR
jgi:hypothetical protein